MELPLPDARDRGHGSADPAGYEDGRATPVPDDAQLHLGSITREFPLDSRRLIRGPTHVISPVRVQGVVSGERVRRRAKCMHLRFDKLG